jgi:uncharacterized damage-inducible protein DinB
MTDLPSFAMRVSNVAASLTFCVEKLGFTLTQQRPDLDIASLLATDGESFVLAGPEARDLSSILSAQHYIVNPGESLPVAGEEVDALQEKLLSKGVTDFEMKQNRIGDRTLVLKLFDNYAFLYQQQAVHTFEDLAAFYAQGPAELDKALAGLSEVEMDLTLQEGSWSIRQIVHHLADTDLLFAQRMKLQLSSPGTVMGPLQPVGNANVSMGREYRERPVASSVTLFRAVHEHMLDVARYILNAGEHAITDSSGQQRTFHQRVHHIISHTDEHLEEIGEIRRTHGK